MTNDQVTAILIALSFLVWCLTSAMRGIQGAINGIALDMSGTNAELATIRRAIESLYSVLCDQDRTEPSPGVNLDGYGVTQFKAGEPIYLNHLAHEGDAPSSSFVAFTTGEVNAIGGVSVTPVASSTDGLPPLTYQGTNPSVPQWATEPLE